MKQHPILFSTLMVQAIRAGRKTMTRRIVKPQPIDDTDSGFVFDGKYKVGDVLWVRESFAEPVLFDGAEMDYYYKADGDDMRTSGKWKPSIYMPREAARIFLKVTAVRVERLMDISEQDALAEGVLQDIEWHKKAFDKPTMMWRCYFQNADMCETARISFFSLWKSINGEESLDANPWVWVYEFERIEKP